MYPTTAYRPHIAPWGFQGMRAGIKSGTPSFFRELCRKVPKKRLTTSALCCKFSLYNIEENRREKEEGSRQILPQGHHTR